MIVTVTSAQGLVQYVTASKVVIEDEHEEITITPERIDRQLMVKIKTKVAVVMKAKKKARKR